MSDRMSLMIQAVSKSSGEILYNGVALDKKRRAAKKEEKGNGEA